MGGFTFVCQVWLTVKFVVGGKTTKQALYICKRIQKLYFSKAACIDVGILHEDFPNTVATLSTQANIVMQYIPLTGTHEKLGPNPKPDEDEDELPNCLTSPLFPQWMKTLAGLRFGS